MNSMAMRSILGVVLLVAGLALGWFGHQAIDGAPDTPTITIFHDWRVACPAASNKDASCEMQQDVLDSKTHSELARLAIFQLSGDSTLVVTVPYNVLLEPGLALKFDDGKPLVIQYETCNGVGCVARVKFDDTLRAALIKSKQAQVLFAGLDQKPVGLPFSVKGYNEALTVYDGAEARRHSWWRRLWS